MARSAGIAVPSPYRVPFDGSFSLKSAPQQPPKTAPDKQICRERLAASVRELDQLQRLLYAYDRYSVLMVFQAMDAAGKDSTIRAVLSGVDPAGCQMHSFKAPTTDELEHDFLWRTTVALPQRGRIGVFNRSYYEEVLAVRVHPEYLNNQRLPTQPKKLDELWQQRYESIRDHERHLARNGTVILKFWLNVSRKEQGQRFLERLEQPEKNWKFESGDVRERGHWNQYMRAYEKALQETSRPWAPWYAIPADSKSYMRMAVAEILVKTLRGLNLRYPELDPAEKAQLGEFKRLLRSGR